MSNSPGIFFCPPPHPPPKKSNYSNTFEKARLEKICYLKWVVSNVFLYLSKRQQLLQVNTERREGTSNYRQTFWANRTFLGHLTSWTKQNDLSNTRLFVNRKSQLLCAQSKRKKKKQSIPNFISYWIIVSSWTPEGKAWYSGQLLWRVFIWGLSFLPLSFKKMTRKFWY